LLNATKSNSDFWLFSNCDLVGPLSKMEVQMAWKAPKIVEVSVGMEINMYACAARK
jgi:coenzyme PQQ precursor peptide PqqA